MAKNGDENNNDEEEQHSQRENENASQLNVFPGKTKHDTSTTRERGDNTWWLLIARCRPGWWQAVTLITLPVCWLITISRSKFRISVSFSALTILTSPSTSSLFCSPHPLISHRHLSLSASLSSSLPPVLLTQVSVTPLACPLTSDNCHLACLSHSFSPNKRVIFIHPINSPSNHCGFIWHFITMKSRPLALQMHHGSVPGSDVMTLWAKTKQFAKRTEKIYCREFGVLWKAKTF